MKISLFKSINLSLLLIAGLLLAITALGCGDDNEGKAIDSGPDVIARDQAAPDTGPGVVDTGVDAPMAWPTTPAECKDVLANAKMSSARNDCLCDNCVDNFGPCLVNANCMEVLTCAIQQGCELAHCSTDPVCGPVFEEGKNSDPNFGKVILLGQCEAKNCAAAPSDSGT